MNSPHRPIQTLPVFLINLDRGTDRLEFMRSQFEKLGLSFVRLPAADGRDAEVLRRSRRSRLSQLKPGEIGCFESHIRAWEELLSSDATAAIVMEDDVILAADFATVAEEAARQLDFDVIKLDFFSRRLRVEDKAHGTPGGRTAFRYLGGDWCTGAYIVSRSGAALLLRHAGGYMLPSDHYMYDTTSRIVYMARIFSIVPAVAAQTDTDVVDVPAFSSDIKDGGQHARSTWKGRAARLWMWLRGDAGPVNRFMRARRLARITRENGLRHVDNTFIRVPRA